MNHDILNSIIKHPELVKSHHVDKILDSDEFPNLTKTNIISKLNHDIVTPEHLHKDLDNKISISNTYGYAPNITPPPKSISDRYNQSHVDKVFNNYHNFYSSSLSEIANAPHADVDKTRKLIHSIPDKRVKDSVLADWHHSNLDELHSVADNPSYRTSISTSKNLNGDLYKKIMSNGNTPQTHLITSNALRNKNDLNADDIRHIHKTMGHDYRIKLGLLSNPKTPEDVLNDIASSGERPALAFSSMMNHPNTTHETISRLAHETGSPQEEISIRKHPLFSAEHDKILRANEFLQHNRKQFGVRDYD